MRQAEIIKDIIGEVVEPMGFAFRGGMASDGWEYIRNKDGIQQIIFIDDLNQYRRKNARLLLTTNLLNSRRVEICEYVPEYDGQFDTFWEYKSEEDYKRIIIEFARIIKEYGIDKLNEISIPIRNAIVTDDMQRQFYQLHDKMAKEFQSNYQLEQMSMAETNQLLYKMITEMQEKEFQEIKDQLMYMAAFWGETVTNEFTGYWEWKEDVDKCMVRVPGKFGRFPLDIIIQEWAEFDANVNGLDSWCE